MFIDASQHFEKATNQNFLRDKDIQNIITTYRDRKDQERFSRKVSLKELLENEYNLNISRYIDTSEEVEPINISVISKQLKSLESEMKNTDEELMAFCKELNIDTPF